MTILQRRYRSHALGAGMPWVNRATWRGGVMAALLAATVAGCAGIDTQPMKEEAPRLESAVNFLDKPPVTILYGDADSVWADIDSKSKPLPDTMVGPVVANNMPVMAVFELMADELGLSVVPSQDVEGRTVTIIDARPRPFSQLVELLAENAGLFYHYDGRTLKLKARDTFFARVPMVGNSLDSIRNGLINLGVQNAYTDATTGLISFEADRPTHDRTKAFMRTFEQGRDMLVYDVWLIEVLLREDKDAGINWNALGSALNGALDFNSAVTSGAAALNGWTIGLMSKAGNVEIGAVLSLLEKSGHTRTIARPEVTFTSGSSSTFDIGEEKEYIGSVKKTETEDDADGETTTETTVDQKTLKTGTVVTIGGSHTNGIIHTSLDININTLLAFETFSTMGENGDAEEGVTLNLPHTAFRKLQTSVDARPGDVLVIGGLIQETKDSSREELYGTKVPTRDAKMFERTETIMMLRPRLVKIRPGEPGRYNKVERIWTHDNVGEVARPTAE